MSTKSREHIYGTTIRMSAERAKEARKEADRLACEAWNARMLSFRGPAQPSPTLGNAPNVGYVYLEVCCLGCDTHQTVALDIVRRSKRRPSTKLERYTRCKDCSALRGYLAAIWWRCAIEALMLVVEHGGDAMLPRIGIMPALYPSGELTHTR